MELTGQRFPNWMIERSEHGRKFFNRKNQLISIKKLNTWLLKDQLHQKYKYTEKESEELNNFLKPKFSININNRATATQMLKHDWLKK